MIISTLHFDTKCFPLGKGFEQTTLCSSKCKLLQINIVVSKQLNVACLQNVVEKIPAAYCSDSVTTSYYCLVLKTFSF